MADKGDIVRNKTAFKLVAVLIMPVLIAMFWRQAISGVNVIGMMTRGQARYCPLNQSLGSYANTRDLWQRIREIRRTAHLVERDSAGLELYNIASQRLWIPRGALDSVSRGLAEQQRGIYDFRGLGAKPGDIVLDAGAYIGLYVAKALAGGAARVVAIEPAPSNAECLRRNLRNEIAAGKVTVVEKGVWDKEDVLPIRLPPENPGGDSFVLGDERGPTLMVPLTTVDKLVAELRLEKVSLIKMDIEGAERRALVGAADTIRRFRPRLEVCVYHFSDDPVVIPGLIRSMRRDYQQTCGPCLLRSGIIYPEVFFYF